MKKKIKMIAGIVMVMVLMFAFMVPCSAEMFGDYYINNYFYDSKLYRYDATSYAYCYLIHITQVLRYLITFSISTVVIHHNPMQVARFYSLTYMDQLIRIQVLHITIGIWLDMIAIVLNNEACWSGFLPAPT